MAENGLICLDLRPLQTSYALRGIGRYTRELSTRLAKSDLNIASLVLKEEKNPLPEIPVLIEVPETKRPWLWDQTWLPFFLWKNKVSLLHNFAALGPLDKISFPVLYASRSIVTIYDLHMFEEGASEINRFYRNTKRIRIQSKGMKKVFKCTVISQQTKNKVQEHFGLEDHKLVEISLGCDHMDVFKPIDSAGREEGAECPVILSIGDTANKNLDLSFKIMLIIRKKYPEAIWHICGKADRFRSITGMKPEAHEWIKFSEDVTDSELAGLYSGTDLLLFPSTEEGFGIPIIEAMRMGCPVITGSIEPPLTILGYDPELDPVDLSKESIEKWSGACLKILDDPEHRQDRINYGLKRSDAFLWQDSTDRILALYKEYLAPD